MNYKKFCDRINVEVFAMKIIDKVLAITAMFTLIIALLLTSFQVAIYGDPEYKFYEKEYAKYNVTESLNMKMEDVMTVTDYMMDYLIGKEAELSIVTDVDGKTQDFFNEQDRLHMWDVQNLFIGGLRIRTGLLGFTLKSPIFLLKLLFLLFFEFCVMCTICRGSHGVRRVYEILRNRRGLLYVPDGSVRI